jgi:phospho-N-acetylmuramoyl-pentapeptide-transferase
MLELGEHSRVEHDRVGRLAVRLNIDRLVAVGQGALHIDQGATQEGSWARSPRSCRTWTQPGGCWPRSCGRRHRAAQGQHSVGLWRLADELARAPADQAAPAPAHRTPAPRTPAHQVPARPPLTRRHPDETVLVAAGVSLVFTLLATPLFIRVLVRQGYGQFIRDDGPTTHHTKRGTPTMGGLVVIVAVLFAYAFAHLVTFTPPTWSAMLVLFLMTGLGLVGLADDATKIRNQRSLGLKPWQKLTGQSLVAVAFAVLALQLRNEAGRTPASTAISFIRDVPALDLAGAGRVLGRLARVDDVAQFGIVVGTLLFIVWAYLMIAATSNGVNLTDGLDGLATGASLFVFAAYTLIGVWQSGSPAPRSTRPRSATRSGTRATSPWSRRRSWGPASASCGGTPRPPRSSWATPARWPSAGPSPGWPSPRRRSCSSSSWAGCSSSSPPR